MSEGLKADQQVSGHWHLSIAMSLKAISRLQDGKNLLEVTLTPPIFLWRKPRNLLDAGAALPEKQKTKSNCGHFVFGPMRTSRLWLDFFLQPAHPRLTLTGAAGPS